MPQCELFDIITDSGSKRDNEHRGNVSTEQTAKGCIGGGYSEQYSPWVLMTVRDDSLETFDRLFKIDFIIGYMPTEPAE